MLLAALLASASLDLHPLDPGQAEVRLCFTQAEPTVSYELLVVAQGPAGRSQTRQSGVAERPCPVQNGLKLPPSTQVDARLRWWLDGVEQVPQEAELIVP